MVIWIDELLGGEAQGFDSRTLLHTIHKAGVAWYRQPVWDMSLDPEGYQTPPSQHLINQVNYS